MEEKTRKITDEELKSRACDAVDELSKGVKKASRDIFDACVERTAEVFSELLDKATSRAKEKIKKGDVKDE